MTDETDKLYARILAQEREIVNLRGGYLIVRGQLHAAMESLKARQKEEAVTIRRAGIAAETAATEVENAASVASDLVLRAAQEEKSGSPQTAMTAPAATAAAALKLVAAQARARVAAIVKAENIRAERAIAGFAELEKHHDAAGTLLASAIELAATIAGDTIKLTATLDSFITPSNK